MKHLRIFETEQQRTSVLNNATYSILHMLAGQRGVTLTIKDSPEPGPAIPTDRVILKFRTTEPEQQVNLSINDCGDMAYGGECFAYMVKDGVTIDENFWSEYIEFEQPGLHTVELVFVNDFDGDLPEHCFEYCAAEEVILSSNITSIGESFDYCVYLTSITIPNSVTSIGKDAFKNCDGLTSVTIPNSVTSIGYGAFYNCSGLTSIVIPNSVTSMDDYAFYCCSGLTSVILSNSITTIGNFTFFGCSSLTSVTIPNSVTSIGDYAFRGCTNLTSLTIGNSVTNIGPEAFSDCSSLASVSIPNSVTGIDHHAFSGCMGLTSVTIGNSITSIDHDAFLTCSGLTSITILNETPPELGSGVFYGTHDCPIYVPASSVDAYKAAGTWHNYYDDRVQAIPTE